jgi:hypothetical protein
MTLDLKVSELLSLLRSSPTFELPGKYNLECQNDVSFPGHRGIIAGSFNYGSAFGQPIRPLTEFSATYTKAIKQHPFFSKYWSRWFPDGQPGPEMQHKIALWYETAVSEIYLYCCLANIFEDYLQQGFVLYDPRLDQKYQADIFVLCKDKQFRINSYFGDPRKIAMQGLPGGNHQYMSTIEIRVVRNQDHHEKVNGFRLFAQDEIDAAVLAISATTGFDQSVKIPTIKELLKNQKTQPF